MFRITPIVKHFIIINVIMFALTLLAENFMLEKFALFYFNSPFFKPYQLISYIFMHGGFMHILFNMYSLYIFGSVLESVWGGKKFFIYYMVTGIGAALFHLFITYLRIESGVLDPYLASIIPMVGASGAIYGLLLAYGVLFPNNVLTLFFPPVSLKAKYMVFVFGGLEFLLGLGGSGDGVAHFAHLGGMLFGFVILMIWKRGNKLY
ncbi:MAG: rhomboid family intramembrane serine protease [Candidatus Egerieousia sp.]|jgi:membrane associated rhomboid family serine protease|nr:rhomboid family intramembrane serine protease [bacterium]MDY2650917.1 rhomboid family intramembrane serine protease [Candidatus Egerieousia sp.]MDD7236880.1 rhomboid family intramembrane serine protease [bacterium]MDY3134874.1 rhomboid family intramembrane serine protease [Candidatus Egerieousia sp.]MDY3292967.1 rhomboid family intramembrane serine protease [Candidatus Egerieousia sp.]